jgi:hypothetical protein
MLDHYTFALAALYNALHDGSMFAEGLRNQLVNYFVIFSEKMPCLSWFWVN